MSKKEELARKIHELKSEYTSGSITEEEYRRRALEIKRDLELLKREMYERPQKGFNKRLLVIPLLIVLIIPASYFLLKEAPTGNTNKDIYTLKNEEESWPMIQGNAQHTGFVNGKIPDKIKVRWKSEIVVSGGQVIAYGRVYVGDLYGKLYCLDADTGEVIWIYDDTNLKVDAVGKKGIFCTPAVWDKKVYFYNNLHYIYCLSAVDGTLLWRYKAEDTLWFASLVVVDGKLYLGLGQWGGRLICLNAENGDLLWDYKGSEATPVVAIYGDYVYCGTDTRTLTCLNKNTGEKIWDYKFEDVGYKFTSLSYWPIIYNQKVVFSSGEGVMYCLNMDNGNLIWKKRYGTRDLSVSPLSIKDKNLCYFLNELDKGTYTVFCLHCINYNTGEEIWKVEIPEKRVGLESDSPPITNGNKVVFALGAPKMGRVYCLSAENGSTIWEFNVEGPIINCIAYYNERIYFSSMDDHIYCLEEEE